MGVGGRLLPLTQLCLLNVWCSPLPHGLRFRLGLPQSLRLGRLSPQAHIFRDDLARLTRDGGHARVVDDRARHALALLLQLVAQQFELGDEPVNLLNRTQRDTLHQHAETVGHLAAVIGKLPVRLDDLAAHEFDDLSFHFGLLVWAGGPPSKNTHTRTSPVREESPVSRLGGTPPILAGNVTTSRRNGAPLASLSRRRWNHQNGHQKKLAGTSPAMESASITTTAVIGANAVGPISRADRAASGTSRSSAAHPCHLRHGTACGCRSSPRCRGPSSRRSGHRCGRPWFWHRSPSGTAPRG